MEYNSENNEFFRCSYEFLPEDFSILKNTSIPISFCVEFDKPKLEILKEDLIRCLKCQAYLNCYSEIPMPGLQWKCNLCENLNELKIPLTILNKNSKEKNTFKYNKESYDHPFVSSFAYEIETPENFMVKTPDPPILTFLIEITEESRKLSLLKSVLNSLKESLRQNKYDPRTKACFVFFNENIYLLNNNKTFTVISSEIPSILPDNVLFSVHKQDEINIFDDIFEELESYFEDKYTYNNDLLKALRIPLLFRTGSVFTFISSLPNYSFSSLNITDNLIGKNNYYKTLSESLYKKNLCLNLFMCTRSPIEFSTLQILLKSGGQAYHYSNYDGTDPTHSLKLFCDLNNYFQKKIAFNAVCRVRTSKNSSLKNFYGNFMQKSNDLIGFSNYNSAHSLNFEVEVAEEIKNLDVQIAMVRILKEGIRTIRVYNIRIERNKSFYYNSLQIAHNLLLNSFYEEYSKKNSSQRYLDKRLQGICKELKNYNGLMPEYLRNLPLLVLCLKKSIPLRLDKETPADFRSFYIYLYNNMEIKVIDLMIYPVLVSLDDSEMMYYKLSRSSLNKEKIYFLDTGINLFLFIGENNKSHENFFYKEEGSGLTLFENVCENEYGQYFNDILKYLISDRSIKPRYIIVNEKDKSFYNEIFFSYMYEDRSNGLPSLGEYENNLQ